MIHDADAVFRWGPGPCTADRGGQSPLELTGAGAAGAGDLRWTLLWPIMTYHESWPPSIVGFCPPKIEPGEPDQNEIKWDLIDLILKYRCVLPSRIVGECSHHPDGCCCRSSSRSSGPVHKPCILSVFSSKAPELLGQTCWVCSTKWFMCSCQISQDLLAKREPTCFHDISCIFIFMCFIVQDKKVDISELESFSWWLWRLTHRQVLWLSMVDSWDENRVSLWKKDSAEGVQMKFIEVSNDLSNYPILSPFLLGLLTCVQVKTGYCKWIWYNTTSKLPLCECEYGYTKFDVI